MIVKQVARKVAYRMRHRCLNSHEQVKSRRLKKVLLILMTLLTIGTAVTTSNNGGISTSKIMGIKVIFMICVVNYLRVVIDPQEEDEEDDTDPIPRLNKRIESFSHSDCKIFFRFNKVDLYMLMELLRIPNIVVLPDRRRITGEEAFLRGLYELASGENQFKISRNVFGGDASLQSRAMSWFIHHIHQNFHHLVEDNLEWWKNNGFFRASADAISAKMGVNDNCMAHFIDCNCLPTSVVGGGPAEEGANSARWSDDIQRAFYNGWKSVHGLKHQTVDNAYGFTVDMCGPTSLRRNDLTLLGESDINNRMMELQLLDEIQYCIFGDSAYQRQSHIRTYYKANREEDGVFDHVRWNNAMKKVRISIEWNYGYTASLFKYVQNQRKLELLKNSSQVSKVYIVATILRNIYVGFYGCQTSNYFDVELLGGDFVRAYINQTEFHV